MRHFLRTKLGPRPLTVSRLSGGVQSPSAPRLGVPGACTPQRVPTLHAPAPLAEPLPPIAAAADSKLDPTSLATRKPDSCFDTKLRSASFWTRSPAVYDTSSLPTQIPAGER